MLDIKMNTTLKNTTTLKQSTIWNLVSGYESLFLFGLLGVTIVAGIILTSIFEAGPSARSNLLFNAAGAIGIAVLFVYIIFKFLGDQIRIFGVKIDIGLIIYICIVLFVIFVLGA
jgi:hypothetical protein